MFHIFVGQVVEVPNVSWDAIGGLENVKRELQEVIGFTPLYYFYQVISVTSITYKIYVYSTT